MKPVNKKGKRRLFTVSTLPKTAKRVYRSHENIPPFPPKETIGDKRQIPKKTKKIPPIVSKQRLTPRTPTPLSYSLGRVSKKTK